MDHDDIPAATRRAVLKATAGAVGVAATGTASAHEWGTGSTTTAIEGESPTDSDVPGGHENAAPVGYHSLGGIGGESTAGRPSAPHHGGRTELRTHGDYAYVTFFSSDSPTPGRGMAIVDISSYNRATTAAEAARAEMSVLSFLPNDSTGTAAMDLKVSDDGDYVFIGTQPYTALFGDEALDPTPNRNDKVGAETPGAVVAVDVSDKGNPQTVGTFQVSGTGVHNLFHHRIGESEYVFAIHDLNDGTEGIYVVEFDRTTGALEPVNRWTADGDMAQGEAGTEMKYIHDIEVQNDPVTGTPTAYLSYWDNGLVVLDVSDPSDLVQIGHFEMSACHFATPAPTLVDGKRVCVASQETPSSESRSGTVHLVDASGVHEKDGVTELREQDVWEWLNEGGDDAQHTDVDVSFGNFELSPHNSSLEKHGDEFWLHQSHYHGGVRYLRIDRSGETLAWDDSGFSRPDYGVPPESMMQGLNETTPNVWTAVASNGVTFASDINQGVHAIKHDEIDLGGAPPTFAAVTRRDDGSLFTGGQTNRVLLDVSFAPGREDATPVRVRDRLPQGWGVVGGDASETYEVGGSTFVEFDAAAASGDTLQYFVEAPEGVDSSGSGTFGPVEVSADGGESWYPLAGTLDSNATVGQSTTGAAGYQIGTAALAAGAVASQRDKVEERLRGLLSRDD